MNDRKESSLFGRQEAMEGWNQESLSRGKVLVVGAGALGNEVAKNLALSGVGQIWIVDRDLVEATNLTRCILFDSSDIGMPKAVRAAERLRGQGLGNRIEGWQADVVDQVGTEWFAQVDLVIGCVDHRESRWWISKRATRCGCPWIDGGLMGLQGIVQAFHPSQGACYECGMAPGAPSPWTAPQGCAPVASQPVFPSSILSVSMVAAMQSQMAIAYLMGQPVPWGTATRWDGTSGQGSRVVLPRLADCAGHEPPQRPTRIDAACWEQPLDQWFDSVFPNADPGSSSRVVVLPHARVEQQACRGCGRESPVQPAMLLRRWRSTPCTDCSSPTDPIPIFRIPVGPQHPMSLQDLNLPREEWLEVWRGEQRVWVAARSDKWGPVPPVGRATHD
ncbi:MAG: HesA/MoeB/ThiF family protein [Pirellulaceae bacterium]